MTRIVKIYELSEYNNIGSFVTYCFTFTKQVIKFLIKEKGKILP
jgi:hypothetical protein